MPIQRITVPEAKQIKRLADDLYLARHTIIDLMRADVADLLHGLRRFSTVKESHELKSEAIDKIIEMVEPDPTLSNWEERARCPLCGSLGFGPFNNGFIVGEGLSRHLWGANNAHPCPVIDAAFKLAEGRYLELSDSEYDAREQQTSDRKKVETLFRVNPNYPPKLVDEGTYHHTRQNLEQAESRLVMLGFVSDTADNIRSYTYKSDKWTVLADPRREGRIDFTVYEEGKKKPRTSTFHFLDTWKRDLPERFNTSLEQAIATLKKQR